VTSPRISGVASLRVVIHVNAEQAPKVPNVGADPFRRWGRPPTLASKVTGWNTPAHERLDPAFPPGYMATTRRQTGSVATREAPSGGRTPSQPDAREGQAGPPGVADRFVVPRKPGNSGGGKEPEFQIGVRGSREPGDWR
jgi:hypothetical protein